LSKKRQYFRHIFRRNILRIITSVPSLGLLYYSV
jgi:ABC-type microcin C transport system permease subunit YejB